MVAVAKPRVTLAELLRFRPDFSQRHALRTFVHVCAEVDAAHASGVVHGDLKPANIVIDDRGDIHVTGWRAIGTPGYVAPQLETDRRNDIYALGSILFEILTHKRLHSITGDRRPSSHAREVPAILDVLCVRAIAIDPYRRIGRARELADTVFRFLGGAPG